MVREAGFAMLDVLVALLLLAVALTGACATLVQTMRATQGALLATRAVDLAADLAEELQLAGTAAEAEAALASWQEHIAAILPVAGIPPGEVATLARVPPTEADAGSEPAVYELTLHWRGLPGSPLRQLRVPVAAPFAESAP